MIEPAAKATAYARNNPRWLRHSKRRPIPVTHSRAVPAGFKDAGTAGQSAPRTRRTGAAQSNR
jgi:hypothetical protein